jgi:hypothetical protein
MTHYVLRAETDHINVSPVGFRLAARDYFKCFLDFEKPGRFSVVPFFLCCRAMGLALKAMHLETKTQSEVKDHYGHDLVKSYSDLPAERQTLSKEEFALLKQANNIYSNKDFEYFCVSDAATGFTRYPDLDALGNLARKVTAYDA